jgi:hypothetical protein
MISGAIVGVLINDGDECFIKCESDITGPFIIAHSKYPAEWFVDMYNSGEWFYLVNDHPKFQEYIDGLEFWEDFGV